MYVTAKESAHRHRCVIISTAPPRRKKEKKKADTVNNREIASNEETVNERVNACVSERERDGHILTYSECVRITV